jgi:hypothetical protein
MSALARHSLFGDGLAVVYPSSQTIKEDSQTDAQTRITYAGGSRGR